MIRKYGILKKSPKQCRERWVNSLCPNVKKGIWSEKEEKTLFLNQLKIGNKWSELAKLIPNRSENDIKNHFYAKLRKYIRKICKEINKNKIFEIYNIKGNLYNANKVYSLIQKKNIPLISLNKRVIVQIIKDDYFEKHKRLNNKLQEFSSNELRIDSSTTDLSNDLKIKEKKNEVNLFGDLLCSDLSKIDFDEINQNIFDNDDNEQKSQKGVNIFEELLIDE